MLSTTLLDDASCLPVAAATGTTGAMLIGWGAQQQQRRGSLSAGPGGVVVAPKLSLLCTGSFWIVTAASDAAISVGPLRGTGPWKPLAAATAAATVFSARSVVVSYALSTAALRIAATPPAASVLHVVRGAPVAPVQRLAGRNGVLVVRLGALKAR